MVRGEPRSLKVKYSKEEHPKRSGGFFSYCLVIVLITELSRGPVKLALAAPLLTESTPQELSPLTPLILG